MNDNAKHIGLDAHQATISAILDSAGKLVMEAILGLKAPQFSSLSAVCVAACTCSLKKEPGRPGGTICSSLTQRKGLSEARRTWLANFEGIGTELPDDHPGLSRSSDAPVESEYL
jgi:hypothetical protein